ncbi:MAG TPA: DUF84 family protein, partial [Candidatus Paceibacterota bacterium]|nr:DUF84 family protein [Candidatus Paceibacterota bacterium]
MKLNVGSQNQIKVAAVREAIRRYPGLFPEAEVCGVEVDVELYGHPKNLNETVEGAIARAKQAFRDCDYGFGLEGGLLEVPHTKSGYMEIGACAVYDGKDIYLGLSPAFEWPGSVNDLIVSGQADASQAFYQLG